MIGEVEMHAGTWLVDGRAEPVRRGAVAVADGQVVGIGTAAGLLAQLREAGADVVERDWAGVITPGLINAHAHLQYTCMAEVGCGTYHGFEDWSRTFQAAYERPHDWAASTAEGYRLAAATGTTAVADVVTDVAALAVPASERLHGLRYWEVFAWRDQEWWDHGRDGLLGLLEGQPAQSLALSPHAPYSLDTEVLRDLGGLAAERGLRRHMHLAESSWETAYVEAGTGALADRWRALGYDFRLLRDGGARRRPVDYVETIGALGPDTHVAHGIYVDAQDRAILRRTGTSVALCPRSNAVIGLDPVPVAQYLQEGNPICVGTDSLSSVPSLDLLADLAALARLAREQGYRDGDLYRRLLDAATHGGAVAMGLHEGAGRLGELTPGATADLAVFAVDGGTGIDVLAALVEAGAGTALATIVSGEVRWDRSCSTDEMSMDA